MPVKVLGLFIGDEWKETNKIAFWLNHFWQKDLNQITEAFLHGIWYLTKYK